MDLSCFFNPRSVAIVGASESNLYSAGLIRNVIKHGYNGQLYPINPKRSEIFGIKCYSSLTEVQSSSLDLVVYCIGREHIMQTLNECKAKGVKGVIIITAAFAEADEKGRALQEEISRFASSSNIRILGPNCFGISDFENRVVLTPDSQITRLIEGNLALVAQSGALGFCTLMHYGNDRNIGFSRVVSTGNEADLQISDFMEDIVRDEKTKAIALFVESIRKPAKFAKAALALIQRKKPIIVLKVGRTPAAARTALTHTRSITGSDRAYDAFFKKYGITRVEDLEDLVEVSSFFSKSKYNSRNGVAVISSSGGLASVCADLCSEIGLELPGIEGTEIEDYLLKCEELMAFGNHLSNPTDVRGQGITNLRKIIKPFLEDDRFGVVVVSCAHCGSGQRSQKFAQDIIDINSETDKCLVALWTGRKKPENGDEETGYSMLQKSSIPVFDSPRRCFTSINLWFEYHRTIKSLAQDTKGEQKLFPSVPLNGLHQLSRGLVPYHELSALLSDYRIPKARSKLVKSEDDAVVVAKEIGYPLAMKIDSPDLSHKTEAKAVILNVRTESELREAYKEVIMNVKSFDLNATINGVVVQEMVQGGIETIVGFSRDPQIGPIVTFGMGGRMVELFNDTSARIAPLSKRDVTGMIDELKGKTILYGYRGYAKADIFALEAAILRFATLASDYQGQISEMEINPLMVLPEGKGVVAADVRAVSE